MNHLSLLARQASSARLLPVASNALSKRFYGAQAKAAHSNFAKRIQPMLDRVIVQKAEAVTRSKGGIVIPEKAQGKVLEGTIIAVGPGARNEKGDNVPIAVNVGDTVILPEYGGTKVEIDDTEVFIYREHDILAILHKN